MTIRCWQSRSTQDIADAAQQQQGILIPGSPAPNQLLNAVQVFQGTVCPQTGGNPVCAPGVFTPGVASTAQYQFGRMRFNDQTFPGFGPVLPFTLHVSKDFEYAYANQANFTIERQLTKDMSISTGYLFVGRASLAASTGRERTAHRFANSKLRTLLRHAAHQHHCSGDSESCRVQ
jgi:hypothetical protein